MGAHGGEENVKWVKKKKKCQALYVIRLPSLSLTDLRAHTRTHTYSHTQHSHTHTQTHIRAHSTHTHIHTHTHTHTHTRESGEIFKLLLKKTSNKNYMTAINLCPGYL